MNRCLEGDIQKNSEKVIAEAVCNIQLLMANIELENFNIKKEDLKSLNLLKRL